MKIHRVAAFSLEGLGGNPAGVFVGDQLPSVADMQACAKDVGYSETVFSTRTDDGWRTRYFAPEMEVPFCGHATIALGATLTKLHGAGTYPLVLNETHISVKGAEVAGEIVATLTSPSTRSRALDPTGRAPLLDLFGLTADDLNPAMPPAHIHGGADHVVICVKSRATLAAMSYDFEAGRALINAMGLITVMLVYVEGPQLFHARNAFAAGGVVEDPATGAATAAFAGYLREVAWPHGGNITVLQGADMGCPSRIFARISDVLGDPIAISGATRVI